MYVLKKKIQREKPKLYIIFSRHNVIVLLRNGFTDFYQILYLYSEVLKIDYYLFFILLRDGGCSPLNFLFQFKQNQFQIRLALAKTINMIQKWVACFAVGKLIIYYMSAAPLPFHLYLYQFCKQLVDFIQKIIY